MATADFLNVLNVMESNRFQRRYFPDISPKNGEELGDLEQISYSEDVYQTLRGIN